MQLRELFPDVSFDDATGSLRVSRVSNDSRDCAPGTVFFAMPGATQHGLAHVDDAVARGACAVVSPIEHFASVPVVVLPEQDLRPVLTRVSAVITGHPERALQLVGTTGTNGKTSVTTFLTSLLRHVGRDAASVGTLTGARTTPAPPELFRLLRGYLDEWQPEPSSPVVAMEVSSHALDQGRVDGLMYDVAIFTNLSHDHLDYHGTMEAYFAAKATLFTAERARHAVVWHHDEWSRRLIEGLRIPHTVLTAESLGLVHGRVGHIAFQWRGHVISANVTGSLNAINMSLALEAAAQLGASEDELIAAVPFVQSVPGRSQVVPTPAHAPTVIVDYAHTPDGLERVLRDVRTMSHGRVGVVVGCGGERDQAKRPIMGKIAGELADAIFVTNDNPRGEEPAAIAQAIVRGIETNVPREVILDRREAITAALRWAGENDVLLVAGKGHESTQTVAGQTLPFDDVSVTTEIVKELF